jgi:predicted O-methyltransferase YrrM
MNKIERISYADFCSKYSVPDIDLVDLGLFKIEDLSSLRQLAGYLTGFKKLRNFLIHLPIYLKNFGFFSRNINKSVGLLLRDLFIPTDITNIPLNKLYPISDYNMKVNIIASFNPKTILEIGTYFGWGAASIKMALPNSKVYTMNPEINSLANNPINKDRIGEVFRIREIEVNQIWADSTKFDYQKLPNIDAAYIDGNHDYDYVYSDLSKISKIVSKVIVLDDYIPNAKSPRGGVRSWGPWNQTVVSAVDDFLDENPEIFQSCYWIEDSPIAVLIK